MRQARGESGRLFIRGPRGPAIAGGLQQVRANGVQSVISREPFVPLQPAQQFEPGFRATDHRHRYCMVQADDGVVGDLKQHRVQRRDLRPVRLLGGRSLVVDGGDGGLDLVRAGPGRAARPR